MVLFYCKNRIKKVIDISVQLDKLYSGVPIYEKAKILKLGLRLSKKST